MWLVSPKRKRKYDFCLVANYDKGTYPKQGSLAQNESTNLDVIYHLRWAEYVDFRNHHIDLYL